MMDKTLLDGPLTKRRLSRRAFVGGAAASLALPGMIGSRRSAAAAAELDFVVWTYNLEMIQDNIKKFQEGNPDIAIKLSDFPWN